MENASPLTIKNFFFITNHSLKDCLELENLKMVALWKILRLMTYPPHLDL